MDTPTYRISPARQIVVLTYYVRPTVEDLQQVLALLAEDPAYQSGYGVILDRRKVPSGSTIYVQKMVRLVDGLRKKMGDVHWALLVSDMESFGMGRMAEQLTDFPDTIRTFWDAQEAERWLTSVGNGNSLPTS